MIHKVILLIIGFLFLIVSFGFADEAIIVKMSTDTIYVTKEPPKAKIEKKPPAPSKTSVWISGRWNWTGKKFVWVSGYWDNKPKGVWVTGQWEKRKRGYVWVGGHWKPNKARKISKAIAKKNDKKWVKGCWQKLRKGRVWVPGHYK